MYAFIHTSSYLLPIQVSFRSSQQSSAPHAAPSSSSSSPPPPPLQLDEETLRVVSRAIMGRLDVVDLVGKNTAYEVAERVRLLLLHV